MRTFRLLAKSASGRSWTQASASKKVAGGSGRDGGGCLSVASAGRDQQSAERGGCNKSREWSHGFPIGRPVTPWRCNGATVLDGAALAGLGVAGADEPSHSLSP